MGRTTRSTNPLRCDLRTLVDRQYGQAASRQMFTLDSLLPSYPRVFSATRTGFAVSKNYSKQSQRS